MNMDFFPYTRFVSKSTYFLNERVVARDCRLLYILSGEGEIETEDAVYNLAVNTLVYYPCGCPYHIKSEKGLLFYTLNFDFTNDFKEYSTMIPQPAEGFDYSKLLNTALSTSIKDFQKTMCLENAVWAKDIIGHIYTEDLSRKTGYKEIQNSYLKILLTEIYRRHTIHSPGNMLCLKIMEAVNQDLTRNIKDIARLMNYHPFYLNEVFKKSEGSTLHKYIMKQRLIRASELITTTQKSLDEIALLCGFSSHSHLTTAFKKKYHITPMYLRRQI